MKHRAASLRQQSYFFERQSRKGTRDAIATLRVLGERSLQRGKDLHTVFRKKPTYVFLHNSEKK